MRYRPVLFVCLFVFFTSLLCECHECRGIGHANGTVILIHHDMCCSGPEVLRVRRMVLRGHSEQLEGIVEHLVSGIESDCALALGPTKKSIDIMSYLAADGLRGSWKV